MLLLWLFSHQVVSDSSLPLAARQASLSLTISWSFAQVHAIALVTPANHLILCCLPLLLPSIFPSIRVFSNELTVCMRWPNSWSFSFSISPSKEYSGLISFKIDWFNLPIVQGTLKSLLQNHSLKASVLRCSAFFMIQLSQLERPSPLLYGPILSIVLISIVYTCQSHLPVYPSPLSPTLASICLFSTSVCLLAS